MKRFEQITRRLCYSKDITCIEVAVMIAVFTFMQYLFNQGGNKVIEEFTKRFGKHAYNQFQVLMNQRRN